MVLEKTPESSMDCEEIKPINSKGNQPWIFIGKTDAEAEAPILWSPDPKGPFIGKDPDTGQDWRQEEKGITEDEMVGWHYQRNAHEFEQTLNSVQLLSHVLLFATPWTAALQASLSITNSRSLLRLTSIESVMPPSHLILCCPLLLLPLIPPSIRVFSNESTLCIRWPKYWSFSFSISPSNEYPRLISFRMNWLDLLAIHTEI